MKTTPNIHENPLHITTRGKILAAILAGAAIFGAVEGGRASMDFLKHHNGNVYSTSDLDSFPKAAVTPYQGESDEQIVEEIDPQLGKKENWPALADVMSYVDAQGSYEGKTVQVPVVPTDIPQLPIPKQ